VAGSGGNGIECNSTASIVGNICIGNNNGIYCGAEAYSLIANNVCRENSSGASKCGIRIEGANSDLIGNICSGNGSDGVQVVGDAANLIGVGNRCYENGRYGLYVIPASNGLLSANICTGNTVADFEVSSKNSMAMSVVRGSEDEGVGQVAAASYGKVVKLNGWLPAVYAVTVTNAEKFEISNPIQVWNGRQISIEVLNKAGGAIGAITWGSAFRLAGAFVNPANGKRRVISFYYDVSVAAWIETSRVAADI